MTTSWFDDSALGVAIDHRIKILCKPTPRQQTDLVSDAHMSALSYYGRKRHRSTDEIDVTCQLAEPSLTGGIAVILLQPREDHPFEEGVDAVIEDCPTLGFLKQPYSVASCGTLDLQDNICL